MLTNAGEFLITSNKSVKSINSGCFPSFQTTRAQTTARKTYRFAEHRDYIFRSNFSDFYLIIPEANSPNYNAASLTVITAVFHLNLYLPTYNQHTNPGSWGSLLENIRCSWKTTDPVTYLFDFYHNLDRTFQCMIFFGLELIRKKWITINSFSTFS
ncbi:hypothetical protein chiPu_0008961 [Chiloscyllium punctatum]|uniref:Uncharacterized protein n=1 Tax=Chiloscyllium punctatum TaxID=137246 RepID=A0A401SJK2_CHIPU|nr:hypothetical protein [Chiloscyllium punctatum]